jgi:glycosyltransferase involved in cell wall biosynthesis
LNEAMAAGVPVIASDRGCIRTLVGDQAGIVIPADGDFAKLAADQAARWIENPDEYRAASQAACERAAYWKREADQVLEQFVAQVFGDTVSHSAARQTAAV